MLVFTAHCKVLMIFIAKVRIIPVDPCPLPRCGKGVEQVHVISSVNCFTRISLITHHFIQISI